MSTSSEDDDLSSSPSEHFQSAQQPTIQLLPEEESLDSTDEELSNASEVDETATSDAIKAGPKTTLNNNPDEGHRATVEDAEDAVSNDDTPVPAAPPPRPNKYRGPASTWRNWTASERELAASLDKLTAKDLSIHLYNAFKLKTRKGTQVGQQQPEVPDDENGNGASSWVPPKIWTAWPLPPDEVPREDEGKRWEDGSNPSKPFSRRRRRPGDTLREILVAEVLRQARKRFELRETEEPVVELLAEPTTGKFAELSPALRPVVMADDELATQILQPTIQHILTKLDDLLMGLHRARSSYLTIDDSASDTQSQQSGRSRFRGRPKKRKRSSSNRDPDTVLISDASVTSFDKQNSNGEDPSNLKGRIKQEKSSSRRPTSQSSQSRKARLGLRDWSDVLNLASLTGWDASVVEKAAARCASLFGQGVTFRTLEEGSQAFAEHSHQPHIREPPINTSGEQGVVQDRMAKDDAGREIFGGVHVDGFLQPIEGKKSWKYPKGSKKRSNSRRSKG